MKLCVVLLMEEQSRYENEMFRDPIYQNVSNKIQQERFNVSATVQWAVKYLKKNNRIVWFLKWYRLWFLAQAANIESMSNDPPPWRQRAKELYQKYHPQIIDEGYIVNSIARAKELLIHYFDLHIPAIDHYSFTNQSMGQVMTTFKNIEEEWAEKGQDRAITHRGTEKLFLNVGDGYSWYDLGKTYCEQEKNIMKHCATAREGATLLSLRKAVDEGKNRYAPVLTFELINGNTLGQMKGRANTKPDPKYHKYIIALLKDPRITEIREGGYLSKNNFTLLDLTPSERAWFEKNKPNIISLSQEVLLANHCTPELAAKIINQFHPLGTLEYDPRDEFFVYVRGNMDHVLRETISNYDDYYSYVKDQVATQIREYYFEDQDNPPPLSKFWRFIKNLSSSEQEDLANVILHHKDKTPENTENEDITQDTLKKFFTKEGDADRRDKDLKIELASRFMNIWNQAIQDELEFELTEYLRDILNNVTDSAMRPHYETSSGIFIPEYRKIGSSQWEAGFTFHQLQKDLIYRDDLDNFLNTDENLFMHGFLNEGKISDYLEKRVDVKEEFLTRIRKFINKMLNL